MWIEGIRSRLSINSIISICFYFYFQLNKSSENACTIHHINIDVNSSHICSHKFRPSVQQQIATAISYIQYTGLGKEFIKQFFLPLTNKIHCSYYSNHLTTTKNNLTMLFKPRNMLPKMKIIHSMCVEHWWMEFIHLEIRNGIKIKPFALFHCILMFGRIMFLMYF